MYTNLPEVQEIARTAFPDYNGKKLKVFPLRLNNSKMELKSYWDGGSREYWALVNMSSSRVFHVPENGTMFTPRVFFIQTLPLNIALVCHSIFCGKDSGITVYVHPDNMNQNLLPAPVELSRNEKIVLAATAGLKSSYAGIKDYRFHEASGRTGINRADWDSARELLITNKFLNRAGAITNEGRNAIGNTRLWDLGT